MNQLISFIGVVFFGIITIISLSISYYIIALLSWSTAIFFSVLVHD